MAKNAKYNKVLPATKQTKVTKSHWA